MTTRGTASGPEALGSRDMMIELGPGDRLGPFLLKGGLAPVLPLLFGMSLWRVGFYRKPKPVFSDQEPGINIF